jgi:hypothetical protein
MRNFQQLRQRYSKVPLNTISSIPEEKTLVEEGKAETYIETACTENPHSLEI